MTPLTYPRCSGKMKILSFIEAPEFIEKILKHLGLWEVKPKPPPKRANVLSPNINIDYSYSQLPPSKDHLYSDVECPVVSGEAAS
jgi:hypothetical protein